MGPSRVHRLAARSLLLRGSLPLLACLLSACRASGGDGSAEIAPATTPVASRPGPFALGELARASDYTMSVEAIRDCHVPAHVAARRGSVRIGLDVALEGTSDREVPANPFYASLRDTSGEVFPMALTGCDPPLPPVRLARGVKARGHLNFDVTRTATSLELRYAPPVLGAGDGQDVEELWFRLRR